MNIPIILPSNASFDRFPTNTASSYSTSLHGIKVVGPNAEVALSSIIFPRKWVNLNQFKFYSGTISMLIPSAVQEHIIERGHYENMQEILDTILFKIPEDYQNKNDTKLEWAKNQNKIKIQLGKFMYLALPPDICELIGFKPKWHVFYNTSKEGLSDRAYAFIVASAVVGEIIDYSTGKYVVAHPDGTDKNEYIVKIAKGEKMFDVIPIVTINCKIPTISPNTCHFDYDLSALFVYTDIASLQFVGDTKTPLLATVPLAMKHHNELYYFAPPDPTYIKLSKERFDKIDLEIRRDNGELIEFLNGKVIVQLSVRSTL